MNYKLVVLGEGGVGKSGMLLCGGVGESGMLCGGMGESGMLCGGVGKSGMGLLL